MGVTPEHSSFIESCTRLSVSLEGPGVYAIASSSSNTCNETGNGSNNKCTKTKNSSAASASAASSSSSATKRRHNNHSHSQKHSNNGDEEEEDEEDNLIHHKEEGIYRNRGHRNSFTISTSAVVHPRQPIGIRHSSSCSSTRSSKSASAGGSSNHMTMDELRAVNRYAESTKSLSYLPQVSG